MSAAFTDSGTLVAKSIDSEVDARSGEICESACNIDPVRG